MNARGTIKATRLEPETGRLQYMVERNSGLSDWYYANDPKFTSEFGDLVKKFIAEPMKHEKRRRKMETDRQQQASPRSASKRTKMDAGSTSSDTSSVPFEGRLPFRPSKFKNSIGEDENMRYSLMNGFVHRSESVGLLKKAHTVKRPSSSLLDATKVSRKEQQPASPTPSSKSKTPRTGGSVSVQDLMRKKILLARSKQFQRDQHRHLLNGLVRSAANKLKPVSMNISPSNHQSVVRSSTSMVSSSTRRRAKTPSPTPRQHSGYSSSPSKSATVTHMRFQQQQAAIHSFLSQPDSFTELSEVSASTSNASSDNSDIYFAAARHTPKRQAASGPFNQSHYSQVILRHRPGWTQLWLFTRTRNQNAINPQVCEELSTALKACILDADTSLILISSSGPTFSSGIDLNYLLDAKDPSVAATRLSQSMTELCNIMLACPKPIFVAVNGLCVGFGVALCCLADVVIATEKAVFSTPYAQLGHVPEGGLSASLQNAVGRALASDMLFTGRRLTAIEALRAGLVSRILWPTNFVQELLVRLDVVVATSSPALEATKFLMRSALNNGQGDNAATQLDKLPQSAAIARAIEAEAELLELFWTAPESRIAMRRYAETN